MKRQKKLYLIQDTALKCVYILFFKLRLTNSFFSVNIEEVTFVHI